MKAIWNDKIIASSDDIEMVEGNAYFPEAVVNKEYLRPGDTHTTCPWKGIASYYDVEVNGQINKDAAWYYPNPTEKAKNIKNRIAFWNGVIITK